MHQGPCPQRPPSRLAYSFAFCMQVVPPPRGSLDGNRGTAPGRSRLVVPEGHGPRIGGEQTANRRLEAEPPGTTGQRQGREARRPATPSANPAQRAQRAACRPAGPPPAATGSSTQPTGATAAAEPTSTRQPPTPKTSDVPRSGLDEHPRNRGSGITPKAQRSIGRSLGKRLSTPASNRIAAEFGEFPKVAHGSRRLLMPSAGRQGGGCPPSLTRSG